MKAYPVNAGFFKLDGGAMFGVVPKSIWSGLNPSDENNMCSWAMRCLLLVDGDRRILIDNGLGDKQDKKFYSYLYLHGEDSLDRSLQRHGFTYDDITDVILTHLHFDHCGGSIRWNKDRTGFEPAFPNATFWSHTEHWLWATAPNAREKASFLKDNILPIRESGKLRFVDDGPGARTLEKDGLVFLANSGLGDTLSFIVVRGHTDAMMLPVFSYKNRQVIYCADLIPSAGHIPVPYVMAYDTRPLITMTEKDAFMAYALKNDSVLFFEHDREIECCSLKDTPRGVRMDQALTLDSL